MTEHAGLSLRLLRVSLAVFLVIAWIGGGATVDVTSTDEIIEILGLPLLLIAVAGLTYQHSNTALERWALIAAAMVALVPMVQLLPLPTAVWSLADARNLLGADLAQAGIQTPSHRWSLIPLDTERAMWALLPALACFLAAMQLTTRQARRVAQLVLGLVLLNLMFGFFQVGLPPSSSLRMHPGIGSGFSGVLVNDNHQATSLVIGLVLAIGLWAHARTDIRHGDAPAWQGVLYGLAGALCVAGIPPTGSRAGMIIALVALAVAAIATGIVSVERMAHSRRAVAGGIVALCMVVLGLLSAWRWMQVDDVDESRGSIARATAELAQQHAPLGSGIGSFVNVFMQGGSPLALGREYVNHAHNEYVQWWLTGGWLAVGALLVALTLLATVGWKLLRMRHRDPVAVACWLSVCVVLAHSWVDFPLRTLSLMTVTATLLGVALAATRDAERHRVASRSSRDAAMQRA